jgi:hypothetical protein
VFALRRGINDKVNIMTMRFRGSYSKIQRCVERTGVTGVWRELPYRLKQYHADNGAVLNWWEKTGTILFQGKDEEKVFEAAFVVAAEAKGRLVRKETESFGSKKEGIKLRRRIERAQASIAELDWQVLWDERAALRNKIVEKLEDAVRAIKPLL